MRCVTIAIESVGGEGGQAVLEFRHWPRNVVNIHGMATHRGRLRRPTMRADRNPSGSSADARRGPSQCAARALPRRARSAIRPDMVGLDRVTCAASSQVLMMRCWSMPDFAPSATRKLARSALWLGAHAQVSGDVGPDGGDRAFSARGRWLVEEDVAHFSREERNSSGASPCGGTQLLEGRNGCRDGAGRTSPREAAGPPRRSAPERPPAG